jgi:hypothetical protein
MTPPRARAPSPARWGHEGSRTGTGGDHEAEDGLISARHLEAALAEDRDRPRHKDRAGDVQVAFIDDWFDGPGLGEGSEKDETDRPAPPAFRPGETIADNHAMYGKMHDALQGTPGAIRSKWFKAAEIVTGEDALGVADPGEYNLWILHDEDEDYLRHVHHELARMNADNFSLLQIGEEIPGLEGLRGKDLDYALVELEQRRVTELTEDYFAANPEADRDAILGRVDRANDPKWFLEQVMDQDVREALRREFERGDYDVSNEAHRVRLGKALVDIVYERDRTNE